MSTIIQALSETLKEKEELINQWLDARFEETPPSFYSSVDLRHSGTKLVPVDTNLFPAGFNNLSPAACIRAVAQVKAFVARQSLPIKRVLIIPENHTRNLGYLDNLNALAGILADAGLEVRLGSLTADMGEPLVLEGSNGREMTQCPLAKEGNLLCTEKGYVPDLVVVNNDMTGGSPDILRGVTQTIVPAVGQGWYRRKKSIHSDAYREVAYSFASLLDIDPWLIKAAHHKCGRISFKERKGIECVAIGVEKVLRQVKEKYDEYGVCDEPYVFVKADSGTYGMGIMTVRSGEEVYEINKKARNKMNVIKEGVQSTEVIIQEGVPTIDEIDGNRAEPMMYMVDGECVGGAYRVNEERDQYGNLNAKGMRFHGMCDEEEPEGASHTHVSHCNFGVFGLIAKLATLAAAREEYGDDYVI